MDMEARRHFRKERIEKMKLLSCNIRCDYDQDGANSFRFRKDALRAAILERKPDIICFQEVLPHVAAWLKESLPGYYVVGCGRDEKLRNEQTSIAYRYDAYNLITMETYWLSPTPDIPASRYEDQSDCPRVCTEVVLEELATGELFRIASVHLDHIGSNAKKEGLEQLLAKLEHPAAFRQAHVILAGDFNAEPHEPEFAVLQDYPAYRDAAEGTGGTWHDFGRQDPPHKIDYILVRDLQAENAGLWKDCHEGVYLSDHYPVEVTLRVR